MNPRPIPPLNTLVFATLFLCFAASHAAKVKGTLTFAKLPPQVALVWVAGGKPSPSSVAINQKDKQFSEKMTVGKSGSEITFKNADNVDHNVFANDAGTGINFDAGLVPPGQDAKLKVTWTEGQVVRIGCKIHPKMQSWIANVPSQAHSILEPKPGEKSIAFTIEGVPDQATEMHFWSPKHEPLTVKLTKGAEQKGEILSKGKAEGTVAATLE